MHIACPHGWADRFGIYLDIPVTFKLTHYLFDRAALMASAELLREWRALSVSTGLRDAA
jgi:hypothetical protein